MVDEETPAQRVGRRLDRGRIDMSGIVRAPAHRCGRL